MSFTQDALIQHIERLRDLVRSAHLKREITAVDSDPQLNFWRVIHGNLLDVSVLEWCKVFGTDDEPTHWKTIVPEVEREAFRNKLFACLGIDNAAWSVYWVEMKAYRNNHVAHHIDKDRSENYPRLDLALESSYFYYDYLIKELRKLGNCSYPDDLRVYCADFSAQAKVIAEVAIHSTRSMKETVL
jgi:hypothetical protein